MLLAVNEPDTRGLLAEIPAAFVGDEARERTRTVLAAPAAREGLGRGYCLTGEVYEPNDTGAYRCHVPSRIGSV